jgi:hypothetical protein
LHISSFSSLSSFLFSENHLRQSWLFTVFGNILWLWHNTSMRQFSIVRKKKVKLKQKRKNVFAVFGHAESKFQSWTINHPIVFLRKLLLQVQQQRKRNKIHQKFAPREFPIFTHARAAQKRERKVKITQTSSFFKAKPQFQFDKFFPHRDKKNIHTLLIQSTARRENFIRECISHVEIQFREFFLPSRSERKRDNLI